MIAAVAWDVDGTLADSEPLHLAALQEVCAHHGADLSDLAGDAFRGVHMLDVWTALRPRLPGTLLRERWLAEIVETYVARAGALRPIAHAREVLADLAARRIRQVCVSNSERRIVDANLAALGIAPFFAFSISLDDVRAGKPDPEPYRLACSRLGEPPHRVVAIEDSPTGAASARRAGLAVVGFSPEGRDFADADAVVTGLDEVPRRVMDRDGTLTARARRAAWLVPGAEREARRRADPCSTPSMPQGRSR